MGKSDSSRMKCRSMTPNSMLQGMKSSPVLNFTPYLYKHLTVPILHIGNLCTTSNSSPSEGSHTA